MPARPCLPALWPYASRCRTPVPVGHSRPSMSQAGHRQLPPRQGPLRGETGTALTRSHSHRRHQEPRHIHRIYGAVCGMPARYGGAQALALLCQCDRPTRTQIPGVLTGAWPARWTPEGRAARPHGGQFPRGMRLALQPGELIVLSLRGCLPLRCTGERDPLHDHRCQPVTQRGGHSADDEAGSAR